MPVHGEIQPYRDRVLGATGTSVIRRYNRDGRLLVSWDTKLASNHLMEFAVAPGGRRLFTVGPCFYTGGMSSLDLRGGRAQLVVRPRNTRGVCGTRLAVAPNNRVVVAQTSAALPSAGAPGKLLVVDGRKGSVLRRIALPAEPADVLVGR